MTRTSKTYTIGVKFTADERSLQRLGLGGTVKFAAFTDAAFGSAGSRMIPAGTCVKRDTDNTLIPAADGAAGSAFLMASDVVENAAVLRGSDATTGLYAGGVFYEDKLPQSLTAAQKTALGPKFTFQKGQGSLIISG
jgi:hypothetical protein